MTGTNSRTDDGIISVMYQVCIKDGDTNYKGSSSVRVESIFVNSTNNRTNLDSNEISIAIFR